MMRPITIEASRKAPVSELILSDRLITLAEDADRAGYSDTAERLISLACTVFDEAGKRPH
jgi:hypothetical protein